MPNYCDSDLFVTGDKKIIEEMLRAVKSERCDFDFNNIIPYPEEFRYADEVAAQWEVENEARAIKLPYTARPKDGFNHGGYEWRCMNWGTKWKLTKNCLAVHKVRRYGKQSRVKLRMLTAWSPPEPVVIKLSTLFPKLKFELRFYESAMQFKGLFRCHTGEIVEHSISSYSGNRGG